MIQDYIHRIGWFVGLLLVQVLILNNVHMEGFATPFVYIYLMIKFASDTGRKEQMLWAFALGLSVDMFADTPGMNASASVLLAFVRPFFLRLFMPRDMSDKLLAFVRPFFLRLFMPRDMSDNFIPGFRTMGAGSFIKYVAVCTLLHHTALYAIEYFSAAHAGMAVLHMAASSVLTMACITAIEGIRRTPANKER